MFTGITSCQILNVFLCVTWKYTQTLQEIWMIHFSSRLTLSNKNLLSMWKRVHWDYKKFRIISQVC